jgi:hypothetical protein
MGGSFCYCPEDGCHCPNPTGVRFGRCSDCRGGKHAVAKKEPGLKEALKYEREGWATVMMGKPVRDMDERIVATDSALSKLERLRTSL